MPIAVIAFDFDPLLSLTDGLVVRWQTIGLAAVIAAVLIVAGLNARRAGLRPDDLLYIVVGVVPGAVVGGRLGYLLLYPDLFGGGPAGLLDPAVGGLELAGGVVGGLFTGTYVTSLLGAPVGQWARTAALPLLVALGAGKLTMILGGSGQGLPSAASWATAYLGPGPWASLAPMLPSHPAQAYEGLSTLGFAIVLGSIAAMRGGRDARDGRLLLVAVAGWALIRAVVSVTWRDPVVIGPFGMGGLLGLAVVAGCIIALVVTTATGAHRERARIERERALEPTWPDAETRPRF